MAAAKKPAPKKAKSKPKAKANEAKQPAISGPSKAEQAKWQAESDVNTLTRAQELMADPKRLAAAKKFAADQAAKMTKIAGKK